MDSTTDFGSVGQGSNPCRGAFKALLTLALFLLYGLGIRTLALQAGPARNRVVRSFDLTIWYHLLLILVLKAHALHSTASDEVLLWSLRSLKDPTAPKNATHATGMSSYLKMKTKSITLHKNGLPKNIWSEFYMLPDNWGTAHMVSIASMRMTDYFNLIWRSRHQTVFL